MSGFVSFVGAGPGDIGLITEKGKESLAKADVVLYDRLANPRLLRLTPDSCELIYCGKLPDRHTMRQEKINEMLVELGNAGKFAVRLKGGDPSIFGRVAEEAAALKNAGISYEIVPGITSSIAAANYAGMPVTHRELSTSFTIRTGHTCQAVSTGPHDKDEHGDTIAYYMGVKNLEHHCQELIKQGFSPETKIAVIEWATTGKQRTVEGTLTSIGEKVKSHDIKNPAMTIIGEVVGLREELQWFEKKRMFGKRILVAKASAGESELEQYFLDQGAEAYAFPALKLQKEPLSPSWIQQILSAEKVLFAAPESVSILIKSLYEEGRDIRDLPRKLFCLSEKTRKVLEHAGLQSEKIASADAEMLQVGYQHKDNNIVTHSIQLDPRFAVIDQRLLEEESWETVIFPSISAVDWFLEGCCVYSSEHLREISFAAIGTRVKNYAVKKGFAHLDEEVQEELTKWQKNRTRPAVHNI
ncbi:uroporphyrinogen-III C-methyltransferase [Alkalicoccus daliensis]|uniref:Uroporphyrinogen-III C-methyltransferase n=1 Tax=Alkalicoccus daliensis TaxID=745820 RepID=A0A1H0E3R8_9BACI|nr:uroporphyrinogen-III C-methyltransferase [Alkalicoccus daliensis]SDN77084.1 uroporphyrinogen III methyltransferase / synthase [Alkalicoccus daliensis]